MPAIPIATAHRLFTEAITQLSTVMDDGANDTELLSMLAVNESISRRLDQVTVAAMAALEQRGAFAERDDGVVRGRRC